MQYHKTKNYVPVDASAEELFVAEVRKELKLNRYLSEDVKSDAVFTAVMRELSEEERVRVLLFCALRGYLN
jgi:transcriptional regulator NrdR family protein